MNTSLILASASPHRKKLLEGLGLKFDVIPSGIEEKSYGETHPARRAQLLATMKAREIAAKHPGKWVIGCDTLVVSEDGALLEKPDNESEARKMLALHSGRVSVVHSGLTLIGPDGSEHADISTSFVHFTQLSPEDMDWWIASGLWKDRSGGFQVDGHGQLMIRKIEGDWSGVVGLPVFLLGQLAKKAGATFLS